MIGMNGRRIGALLLVALTASGGCGQERTPRDRTDANRTRVDRAATDAAAPAAGQAAPAEAGRLAAFQPLPDAIETPGNPRTPEKVALGRMLYYDTRLSSNGEVSCYVCHPLHDYGTSHRARGVGVGHQEGSRNDPTVYNAAGQVAQFWDGRAADIVEQAGGPVLNPIEHGLTSEAEVLRILRGIPGYVEAFRAAVPGEAEPLGFENFRKAIAAFEGGLVTPAPWDRYLEGDAAALTEAEREGFAAFVGAGCAGCHSGTYVGGSMFQKLGAARAWPDSADLGRYEVTGAEGDRLVFKVPMLRNVTHTWPYFHDGSVATIEEAVRLMGRHQLGRELTDAQVASIVTWLHALGGEIPIGYMDEPALPPSPAESSGPATGATSGP